MTETETQILALLPAKAADKIKPKPKKAEIIAALVILKRQQWIARRTEINAQIDALGAVVDRSLRDYIADNGSTIKFRVSRGWRGSGGSAISSLTVDTELRFDQLPAATQKALRDYHGVVQQRDQLGVFDEKRIRQQITDEVNSRLMPHDRVQLLLDTPATKKALQDIIASMDAPPRDPRNQNA